MIRYFAPMQQKKTEKQYTFLTLDIQDSANLKIWKNAVTLLDGKRVVPVIENKHYRFIRRTVLGQIKRVIHKHNNVSTYWRYHILDVIYMY